MEVRDLTKIMPEMNESLGKHLKEIYQAGFQAGLLERLVEPFDLMSIQTDPEPVKRPRKSPEPGSIKHKWENWEDDFYAALIAGRDLNHLAKTGKSLGLTRAAVTSKADKRDWGFRRGSGIPYIKDKNRKRSK